MRKTLRALDACTVEALTYDQLVLSSWFFFVRSVSSIPIIWCPFRTFKVCSTVDILEKPKSTEEALAHEDPTLTCPFSIGVFPLALPFREKKNFWEMLRFTRVMRYTDRRTDGQTDKIFFADSSSVSTGKRFGLTPGSIFNMLQTA